MILDNVVLTKTFNYKHVVLLAEIEVSNLEILILRGNTLILSIDVNHSISINQSRTKVYREFSKLVKLLYYRVSSKLPL